MAHRLKNASDAGDELQIHHAPQDHAAAQVMPAYAGPGAGSSMVRPDAEHAAIPNIRGEVGLTPRQLLARDIWNLHEMTNAPNPSIQELLAIIEETYPGVAR